MSEESNSREPLTRQSLLRKKLADIDGRCAHRNGRPPFLELEEIKTLTRAILLLTVSFHNPTLNEVAKMVFSSFPFAFFLGI
jgi:hypothetical protein